MELHLDQELNQLKDQLLTMAGLVEANLARAMRALTERDSSLCGPVEKEDDRIDELEMQVDDMCLKILARRAPVASDLRRITVALKASTDLERIGDQAVSIARLARELNTEPLLKPYIDIPRMAAVAMGMIHDSLDALVRRDPGLARSVIPRDQEVDRLNKQLYRELTSFMLEDPGTITRAIRLMFVSKFLERIADHAANIAEDVVFLYEGKDIRHPGRPPRSAA
jgi:phosphate transport system protein